MNASIHNAKRCTLEGVDCWIGVIFIDGSGRFGMNDMSPECDSEADCVRWCRREMARRGAPDAPITVDRTPAA